MSFHVLGLLVLDGCCESRQCRLPHVVQVLAHGGDPSRVDAIDATSSFWSIKNQPRLFEYPEMLGYGRPAHRQRVGQFAYRPRLANEPLEDGAPGWIAERLERLERRPPPGR